MVPQSAVRPPFAVFVTPVVKKHPGLQHAVEQLPFQTLLAQAPVERFYVGILPRTAALDEARANASALKMRPEDLGIQLGNRNYLVPVDFNAENEVDAKYKAYPADMVLGRWSVPARG